MDIDVYYGTITNTDATRVAAGCSYWTIDASAMTAKAAGDIAVDHLNIRNGSTVVITSLQNSIGRALGAGDENIAGGGTYTGKTLTIYDGGTTDSDVILKIYGDVTLQSDENDTDAQVAGGGTPYVISATGSASETGARGLALTSITGGLISGTAHDGWYFNSMNAVITLITSPVVKDTVKVLNGSNVVITSETGSLSTVDYGNEGAQEETEWTIDGSGLVLQLAGNIAISHLNIYNGSDVAVSTHDRVGRQVHCLSCSRLRNRGRRNLYRQDADDRRQLRCRRHKGQQRDPEDLRRRDPPVRRERHGGG